MTQLSFIMKTDPAFICFHDLVMCGIMIIPKTHDGSEKILFFYIFKLLPLRETDPGSQEVRLYELFPCIRTEK